MLRSLTLLALAASSTGCLSWTVAEPYTPVSVTTPATNDETFEAARLVALGLGGRLLDVQPERRQLVAILSDNGTTRDRIAIAITELGELIVSVKTELFDGRVWKGSDHVCASYTYAREHLIAGGIVDVVTRQPRASRDDGSPYRAQLSLRAQELED